MLHERSIPQCLFLRAYDDWGLPGRECVWALAGCGPWGSWVEHVSRHWELALRTWDGIEGSGVRGSTGGRKDGCVTRICADPWNGGREGGEDTAEGLVQSWGTRLVNWNWRGGGRGKIGCRISWPSWLPGSLYRNGPLRQRDGVMEEGCRRSAHTWYLVCRPTLGPHGT